MMPAGRAIQSWDCALPISWEWLMEHVSLGILLQINLISDVSISWVRQIILTELSIYVPGPFVLNFTNLLQYFKVICFQDALCICILTIPEVIDTGPDISAPRQIRKGPKNTNWVTLNARRRRSMPRRRWRDKIDS